MLQNNYWTSNPNPERDTTTFRRKNKSIHKDKRKTEHHMQINRFNQTNNRHAQESIKNETKHSSGSRPSPRSPYLMIRNSTFFLFSFPPFPLLPLQNPPKAFSSFPCFCLPQQANPRLHCSSRQQGWSLWPSAWPAAMPMQLISRA